MELLEKIQRDIDEIAEFGYCNYSATFSTLIEAKNEILKLRKLVKESKIMNKSCNCKKPKLQPQTRKCGKCGKYIERVRHIILTNPDD